MLYSLPTNDLHQQQTDKIRQRFEFKHIIFWTWFISATLVILSQKSNLRDQQLWEDKIPFRKDTFSEERACPLGGAPKGGLESSWESLHFFGFPIVSTLWNLPTSLKLPTPCIILLVSWEIRMTRCRSIIPIYVALSTKSEHYGVEWELP